MWSNDCASAKPMTSRPSAGYFPPGGYESLARTTDVPPVPSALSGIHERLSVHIAQANSIADHACRIADEVFGARPGVPSGPGNTNKPSGAIDHMRSSLDDLEQALNRLNAEVERLACL